jgi:tetratricopeptide (TPR) repeat protein
VTRTLFLRLFLVGYLLWPSHAYAQAKDAFVDGLTQLINAVDGTYGDEGPAMTAAVEAMRQGLAAWDARVAGVEAGFRTDVASAAPPVAARMRATLGTVYLERGRIEDALAQFSAAVDLDPSLAQVHVLRGLAYERSNRPTEAAAAYRAAWQAKPDEPSTAYLMLRIDPANAAARTALWTAIVRRAESPGATGEGFPVADLIDDASVAQPLFARAAYGQAFASIRQGKYDEALVRFREAAAADTLVTDRALQSEEARRGSAALRAKNVADAIRALESAAGKHPESSDLHRVLGLAHAAAKQYEKSLSELRTASRLNPRDERARLALADVLVVSGNLDAAMEVLRETIREIPQSAEAHWQQGRLDQARADAGAVRAFERAAAMPVVAGLGRLYAIVGQAHHAQFDVAAAAAAYRVRIRLTPNDRDAHIDLAEVDRAQDKLDDALVELLAAALLDPSYAKTFGLIGQVQAAAGRDDEAVIMLRRAVTLDSALLDARYALSRALLRLGRTDEAAAELRAFEQAQAKAMDEQRRQFRENQQKIDEVLKGK